MAQPTEPTMLDPKLHDVVKTLVTQQLTVIAAGSKLASMRKEVGELKKERDGTIAELARLEIKFTNMELPIGLALDDKGYVIAEADDEDEEDEE